MKNLLILSFLSIFAISLFGQVENSEREAPSSSPRFYLDAAEYKSEQPGKTRVDVFLQVPYSSVQFVKSNNGFAAKYSVTVSVFDEDKDNIIMEKMWNESVNAENFSTTDSKTNYNLSLKSFQLAPGDYLMRAEVYDKDSKKTYVLERPINVKEIKGGEGLSSLILIQKTVKEDSLSKVIPNISQTVTTRDEGLPFFFEVYSDKAQEIDIEYQIKDAKNEKSIYNQTFTEQVDSGRTMITQKIEDLKFTIGQYKLVANVKDESGDKIGKLEKSFYSKIFGFPRAIEDLEKAIEQMVYIATNSDIDFIEDGDTYEERLQRYIDYWKSKDPSPQTEENEVLSEYYRRVGYANENFDSYYDGWRSDMGMIYITLGPPSYVERHPFDYNSKPYEVWDYYDINKRFVFVDRTGFGDYRLLDPVYGDWYRYRN